MQYRERVGRRAQPNTKISKQVEAKRAKQGVERNGRTRTKTIKKPGKGMALILCTLAGDDATHGQ